MQDVNKAIRAQVPLESSEIHDERANLIAFLA
jgi:hypothetical protein